MSVPQIIDEVFADYPGQGRLMPAWRWELADASVYPQRSLCIQYQESDLDFVHRLLREEGLFYWFEHGSDSHTLVIADHNGAFAPNPQQRVRYTQSGATLEQDSLSRWERAAHVRSAGVQLASADYRSLSLRPVSAQGSQPPSHPPIAELGVSDVPGAYAYEDSAQGERLALRRMQAIDALRERASASGSLRTSAPGSTFTLLDHPTHDGSSDERDRFVILAARHRARNNLGAALEAQVESLARAIRRVQDSGHDGKRVLPNDSDEPLYRCDLNVQRAAVPVRPISLDEHGQPDARLNPRPGIHGVQTAIVVGANAPVHTDRDHRIKVQFHWQRGANGSHRLEAQEDNAPASDASGTWVRVGEAIAGANWGSNFTPRLGQEVVVAFVQGDIDRPIVIGSVYNGAGQPNAQANQTAAGAAGSTGNACAWFPGDEAGQGRQQGHAHAAVLAGFKTQEPATSRSGSGGSNQLVFDDTPQGNRIELSTTAAATRLQLGHLLHQRDNQRLQPRGHGLDLASAAWGALRAGSGLLLSAHARPGSQGTRQHIDSREPQAALEQAREQATRLGESAQAHDARLAGEPAPAKLDALTAMSSTLQSLQATDTRNAQPGPAETGIGGGAGTADAWQRPDLVAAAPGGIAALTPASTVISAGRTMSLVAQDINASAGANFALASAYGIVLYTYGKASNPDKPNQETGIKLHAASGSVSMQSQTGASKLTASQRIDVSSTSAMVKVAAPKHVLLTAAGAALRLEGSNITLGATGKVQFKASMKELAGPASASASLRLPKPAELKGCTQKLSTASAKRSPFVER